jgi:hypothetical protein
MAAFQSMPGSKIHQILCLHPLLRYKAGQKSNELGNGDSAVPQSKKKTAVKTGKSASNAGKQKPAGKPVKTTARKPAARKPAPAASTISSKKAPRNKASSKKASVKLKTTTASKKVTTSKSSSKKPESQTRTAKKSPDRGASADKPTRSAADARQTEKAQSGKASSKGRKQANPADSMTESGTGPSLERNPQQLAVKPSITPRENTKKKNQGSDLAGSIQQGLGKHGQKKRGWRDIEALTERARLKSLLSDIWHEDIDLDSDIFGETDQFSSYYTDKEEEIEVEDDEDEEWEEFEEDES